MLVELEEVLDRGGIGVITTTPISHSVSTWIDMYEVCIPQLHNLTVHNVVKGVRDHSILKCT